MAKVFETVLRASAVWHVGRAREGMVSGVVKLVAIYKHPEDVDEFERRYSQEHMPLVWKMPGLRKVELSRFTGRPGGGRAAYHMMAELYFDSEVDLQASMRSPEGVAAAGVLMEFAGDLVTFLIADVRQEVAQ